MGKSYSEVAGKCFDRQVIFVGQAVGCPGKKVIFVRNWDIFLISLPLDGKG